VKQIYEGIEIAYDEDGNTWKFELRGRARSAESLTKAKEAIDKEPAEKRKQTFHKFDAYVFSYHGGYKIATVTSVAEGGWRGDLSFWISQDGKRSKERAANIFPVNAHNTKLIEERKILDAKIEALQEEAGEVSAKLECAKMPTELA
jgi:hypothetical protein